MCYKIFDYLSYLSYYFFHIKDIELEVNDYIYHDIDLESDRKTYLIAPIKIFIWRKSAMLLLLPLLILDFIFNIVSYHNDVISITSNTTELLFTNTNWHNSTEYIIDFLHPHKTQDYLKFYTIWSCIFIFLQIVYSSLALYYNRLWYSSSKWLRYNLFTSIIWIYLIYLNTVMNYLKLKSSYDSHKSYEEQDPLYGFTYIFIIFNLLKEVLPIILSLYDGLIWSSLNLKYLFPKNLFLGYVYNGANIWFFLSSGFLFLVVNQLFNNYLISVAIWSIFLGYLIPYYRYRNKVTLCMDEDETELKDIISYQRLIQNIFYLISFILVIIYVLTASNPFKIGLYRYYAVDIFQFLIKLLSRMIFYKLVFTDSLFKMMLHTEKYNNIYQDELKKETKKLRDIENQLYIQTFYSR
jgi:hypothetical protein